MKKYRHDPSQCRQRKNVLFCTLFSVYVKTNQEKCLKILCVWVFRVVEKCETRQAKEKERHWWFSWNSQAFEYIGNIENTFHWITLEKHEKFIF